MLILSGYRLKFNSLHSTQPCLILVFVIQRSISFDVGQGLLYTRAGFLPKQVAKKRLKMDKICFITIEIEALSSAKSDKIMFCFCLVFFTAIISEFQISIMRFKFSYIPHGIWVNPLLFVLKCDFGLILTVSSRKKISPLVQSNPCVG